MATLTIRNVPDHVKQALREQAACNGVSMEEEVRRLLELGVRTETPAKTITAKEILDLVRKAPKGRPIDPRYEQLSHKELTDLMWDGEL